MICLEKVQFVKEDPEAYRVDIKVNMTSGAIEVLDDVTDILNMKRLQRYV